MGVDMQPEDVAEAIELAVDGKRIGYVLGTPTRPWYVLNRLLPEWARIRLIRYLTGH
jgi:hypothetical protein